MVIKFVFDDDDVMIMINNSHEGEEQKGNKGKVLDR